MTTNRTELMARLENVATMDLLALVGQVTFREGQVVDGDDLRRWASLMEEAAAAIGSLGAGLDELQGTPAARFLWLLAELHTRFPDQAPLSATAPEGRILERIDLLRAEQKRNLIWHRHYETAYANWQDCLKRMEQAEARIARRANSPGAPT